ncbi:MAG: DUF434 domain-containing protein [Microscillaceae bacterium]
MPHQQKHRGQHILDAQLFSEENMRLLREAARDMVYLLNRGFPENATLKLVGDRYRLQQRQRTALMRCVCGDEAQQTRGRKEIEVKDLQGQSVAIDGYNLLITTECALSGGILLYGRDGCYRDLASVHGSYRKVEETLPAIRLMGQALAEIGVSKAFWWLDAPISNSGRLKKMLLAEAQEAGWPWQAELVSNPDKVLAQCTEIVLSSDSWVIENSLHWANFQAYLIEQKIPTNSIRYFT